MNYTHEVEQMCMVKKGPNHGPAPIPQEGAWTKAKEITDISGLTLNGTADNVSIGVNQIARFNSAVININNQ